MKKRLISIILTLCMVLSLLPGVTQPAMAVGEGTGTPEAFTLNTSGVNIITNADQLAYMGQQVSANDAAWASARYKLGNDIDLSAYTDFVPIGKFGGPSYKCYAFTGTFDGAGYAIKNLSITANQGGSGLFAELGAGGTIKNLALTGCDLYLGDESGTIVGNNYGTIQNCYSQGRIIRTGVSSQNVGGIVGTNYGPVENCYFSGSVTGASVFGGIVGLNASSGQVLDCYRINSWATNYLGTGLSAAQMQGFAGATDSSWSDITISGVNKGKLSLVDALNQWVSAQAPGSFTPWYCSSADGNAYPGFVKEEFIVNISDGTGVGTSGTTAAASLAGAITSGTTCVAPGETVTITFGVPDSAYKVGSISVYKTGNSATTVGTTLLSAGVYQFTMPRYPVTIAASYATKATGNKIGNFYFTDPAASGLVNYGDYTVKVTVPYGTNVSSLSPVITLSFYATINPNSGEAQDFTSDVIYTVTAENGDTRDWTVIVSVKAATPTGVGFNAVTSMLTGISDGMEYSVNGGSTWVKITGSVSGKVAIAGVTAANDVRVRNNSAAPHTAASDASIIDITQAAQPSAPTINAITANSVTLTPVNGNEYSMDGSTWQASNFFDKLSPATGYTFYQRVAASGTTLASVKSDGKAQYTAAAKPSPGVGYSINYATEKITVDSGYEVSTDADFGTGTAILSNVTLSPGATYYVRTMANGGVDASEAASFTIPARPATPAAITATNIAKTATAITISNTVDGQEYQVNGTWYTPASGKVVVTGLDAGSDYPIVTRVKATSNSFASLSGDPLTVKTKTAPAAAPAEPTIGTDENKPTSDSITISPAAGNEYYISTSNSAPTTWPTSGNDYFKATGTDVHTFMGLTAGTQYYIHVRVAETDAAMPSASAYVTQYTLPTTPTTSAVTINYAAETISFDNTYEVSSDSSFASDKLLTNGAAITPGATYYVRKAADTTTTPNIPASAYVSFTVTARPAEPSDSAYSYDYENEQIIFAPQYEVYTATTGGGVVTSAGTAITPGGTWYIRLKATSSEPASGWTTIAIPARPAATGLSVTAIRTDTAITVAAIDGAEYSKDGGATWHSSNEFTGLNPNTEYPINIRYAATDSEFASTPLGSVTLKTKTVPGATPSVPSVSAQTYDSITIDTILGYQYAITTSGTAPTTWDAAEAANGTKTFPGLSPATQYYVWVRAAETDTAMPSGHISKSAYTAAAAPDLNAVAIDYRAETITFAGDTYEVNTKSDFSGTEVLSGNSIAAFIAGSGTEAQSLFVRVKAITSGAPASAGTAVSIPARPATPAAAGSNETICSKNDGKITGVTTAMEWKLSGGTYAAVTADQALNGITGLSDATYYVRCAAVTSGSVAFASAEQEINIAAGYTITVTFDSQGGSAVSQITPKSYGDKITETVTPPTFSGYNFAGWYKDPAYGEMWSFAIDTLSDNVTLYAKWSAVPTYTVTGAIVDDASPAAAVKDANVKIMQGTIQYGTTGLTDVYGDFTINNVPAGKYNLVITKGTKTAIIMITVSSGNVAVGNAVLPSGNANSILVISGSDTPDVVVGGLNTEAKTQLGTNTSVVITMTVEKKEASTAANGTEVSASVESTGQHVGMILDINLSKSVNSGFSMDLAETSNLIEAIIPIPTELYDKATYKIYRYHGNTIDTITEAANKDGEKIVIDRTNWTLTLYAKRFSTYAIGYTNPSKSASYVITASAGNGGSISPSSANVSAYSNQTFTITANAGYSISDVLVDGVSVGAVSSYIFSSVRSAHTIKAVFKLMETALPYYVKDGETVFIGFSSDASGAMKYIAPNDVTVLFKENPKNFIDTSDHWAKQYIDFVTERELFVGMGGAEFSPQSGMTRAMFATAIGRLYERSYGMLQSNSIHTFTDVDYDAYYGAYVDWAAENNIITGVGGGLFETDREITRQEMATILYRFAKFLNALPDNISNAVLGYPDSSDIAGWAKEAAVLCQQTGIITGRDGGNFVPTGTATRAEVAAILQRFIVATVK